MYKARLRGSIEFKDLYLIEGIPCAARTKTPPLAKGQGGPGAIHMFCMGYPSRTARAAPSRTKRLPPEVATGARVSAGADVGTGVSGTGAFGVQRRRK